ncbi:MAG: ASPIC/UnbV domain-containing protein, partial [Flavobacteriales bacterium]
YINSGNSFHWLTVNLLGTASNKNGIGAKVYVTSDLGTQMREIRSGDGFRYMSSLNAHFGLGQDSTIYKVEVRWPSGDVDQLYGPAVDGAVTITEGTLGNTSGVATTEANADGAIYPNPVTDVLTVAGLEGAHNNEVAVIDVTGKRVLEGQLKSSRLDVSTLRSGVYMLSIRVGERSVQHRFVKQ